MSKLYVISDLHLGHRGVLKWRTQFETIEEHDNYIIEKWNSIVKKHDTVYILGDVAFSKKALARLDEMKGKKILIAGNHDTFGAKEYLKYFHDVRGFWKKNDVWLSHCPIHEVGARGFINIHGHLHSESIESDNVTHINVCCENVEYEPVDFKELVETAIEINNALKSSSRMLLDMECETTLH